MSYTVKILSIRSLTHDVKEYKVEKPDNYTFTPGQATEVSINTTNWKDKKRPFTFTSLPEDDHLEFVIKSYHDHDGVTHRLDNLLENNEIVIGDPWGAIEYKGPGIFIAGGAGITPFISIFRDLEKNDKVKGNKLIFSNKTGKDVILESYFQDLLEEDFISTITREDIEGHDHSRVNMQYLGDQLQDFSQNFYVCGPNPMVKEVSEALGHLGASSTNITFEE